MSTGMMACGASGEDDDDINVPEVIVTAAAHGDAFSQPMDAIPSPDGGILYFVASSLAGRGVFSVPGMGGEAEALFVGAPFVAPRGISMSTDGQTLYIADPGADLADDGVDAPGALFVLRITGGEPTVLAGTAGTRPTALDVVYEEGRMSDQGQVIEEGQDQIYFASMDPSDERPAIMKLPAVGGVATILVKGSELVFPDGVAVRGPGDFFVADRSAGEALGRIFHVSGGVLETAIDEVKTGEPAGIALTLDRSLLLVSAMDAVGGTDRVVLMDVEARTTSIFTDVIGINQAGAGVHRAHNTNVFAWADLTAGSSGTVYRIEFK